MLTRMFSSGVRSGLDTHTCVVFTLFPVLFLLVLPFVFYGSILSGVGRRVVKGVDDLCLPSCVVAVYNDGWRSFDGSLPSSIESIDRLHESL